MRMEGTLQFFGYILVSIVAGLMAYQTPPESWAQLGNWIWQPSLNGLYVALGAMGVNIGAQKLAKK